MTTIPIYLYYIIVFVLALSTCLYGVPRIIKLANRKHIFDNPDSERKMHANKVPNLGGIGIFFSFIIIASLFIAAPIADKWGYIVAGSIILFIVGVKDDLSLVSAYKKLLAQIIAAFIFVYFADIRIHSLQGLFGVYDLSYWLSVLFSTIGCAFIINAVNLIDGIDGLAGSFTALTTFLLGICFAGMNLKGDAIIAFTMSGAIIGFLRYNIAPAKVFMGDSGSLVIGYIIAVLSILLINSNSEVAPSHRFTHSTQGLEIIALSFLFIPAFDCFRVFIARSIKGISPFRADRNHLHYYLLDTGLSQSQSVFVIIISNMLIILLAFCLQDINPTITIACLSLIASILTLIAYSGSKRKKKGV